MAVVPTSVPATSIPKAVCFNIELSFWAQRLVSLGWRELSGGRSAPCHNPLQRLAAEGQEQDRGQERVEKGRADQPAEDRDRDGMQDFAAGLVRPNEQRQECESGR